MLVGMRRWAVAGLACAVATGTVGAQPAAGSVTDAPVDATAVIARYRAEIPVLMARENVPGLAVVVVDGDRVVWQEGFGVADEGGTATTPDTTFSVQSTSKTVTATAVMLAVQAGLLDLDVPITRYLPRFTVHSAFEEHPERRITVRMLLGHTAGFTHEAPLGNNYVPEPGDFEAHVRSISDTWLRFPVGTGYAYSNLGIDLAGHILEVVTGRPFASAVTDSLFEPLGMDRSTFDRATVARTRNRAVGHAGPVEPPRDSPMTAAGGLWTSARDLGSFLRFQLGDGRVAGRQVLSARLMEEMRTVPAPDAGAPAGYALGVARTRWRAGRNLDLFSHGGGGNGFLSDLMWLPQLQLGVAVLTNSSQHDLQGTLALRILADLATQPAGPYHERLIALPEQSQAGEPDSHFVPPPDLTERIASLALPASSGAAARWSGYPPLYRTGRLGAMDPLAPPSRFHVDGGVPWFDASEDGTPIRHRLVEFRPGLFIASNGETLDLREPAPSWRGLRLNPGTNGPLGLQWVLLGVVVAVAAAWLLIGGVATALRRRRGGRPPSLSADGESRWGRRATVLVAVLAAVTAIATAIGIRAVPGIVDVGFLGWMPFTLPVRAILHLPLATLLLAGSLVILLVVGGVRAWWPRPVRWRDAVLALALSAFAAQLVAWNLVPV